MSCRRSCRLVGRSWVRWFLVVASANPAVFADDPVHFNDAQLKLAVEGTLRVLDPNAAEMLGLRDLVCTEAGIADLTGLEHAVNLQTLSLRGNRISGLSALSGLVQLRDLNLSKNQISDVSALSGLIALQDLNLHANSLIADISPLSGLSRLQTLTLRWNHIKDISVLSNLTNLESLNLQDNSVSDLSALSRLDNLRDLELYGNPIGDISDLLGLSKLHLLDLRATQLDGEAYCNHLAMIRAHNPYVFLEYDPRVSPPNHVSASDGTYPGRVMVTWDGVCNGPGYTSYYRVFRTTSSDGAKVPVSGWQTSCTWDDLTAEPGTRYTYWVRTALSSQGLEAGPYSAADGGWHRPSVPSPYRLRRAAQSCLRVKGCFCTDLANR